MKGQSLGEQILETYTNFAPRFAFSRVPDKKSTWVLHLRPGLFDALAPLSYATEVNRLKGLRQQSTVEYIRQAIVAL